MKQIPRFKSSLLTLALLLLTLAHAVCQELPMPILNADVDKVWRGDDLPHGFSGKEVIIGVTDWGFDYAHPVFWDSTYTNYRILRAWDQYRQVGPAPNGYNYGTEWVGESQLLDNEGDTCNIYDYHYHGTHVASIAAGSGAGTKYKGVAYDAELLLVTIAVSEQAVIDAFNWMHDVATREGKRLVINMSWGLFFMGNMDGTGRLNETMRALAEQGVLFVSSAGNNGDTPCHLSYNFDETPSREMKIGVKMNNYMIDHNWGQSVTICNAAPDQPFSAGLFVYGADFQPLGASPMFSTADGNRYEESFFLVDSDTIFYTVEVSNTEEFSRRHHARLRIKHPTNRSLKIGMNFSAAAGEIHAWNIVELSNNVGNFGTEFVPIGMTWATCNDLRYSISAPSNSETPISVAAHYAGTRGAQGNWFGANIANFSSVGPIVDGREKPDISAPGVDIIAALSSRASETLYPTDTVVFNDKTYPFGKLSGTSMSSPFVAGVAALMLEANPLLSPQQVKEIIKETATLDQYTAEDQFGTAHFGAGKVNAYAAVLRALQTVGTAEMACTAPHSRLFPNPANDHIAVILPNEMQQANVNIYDLHGRLVLSKTIHDGANYLTISELAAGCYVVKVNSGSHLFVHKLIKQKP